MRSASPPSGWPGRERLVLVILGAVLAAILAVFFASHTLRSPVWFALAGWMAAAMALGIRVNRPPYAHAWYLLAAGGVLLMASNNSDFAYARHTLPGFADWLGLAGYPLALLGLRLVMKHRLVGRDSAGTLDALIVVFAVAYAAWVYLVVPYYHSGGEPWDYRLFAVLDPLGDLLLLGMLLRLIISPGSRNAALWLLGAGAVFQAGADVVEAVLRLNSSDWFGSHAGNLILVLCWLLFGACWVAAALVPSAHDLTRPVRHSARDALPTAWSRPPRIAPLVAAALVTPSINALELAESDVPTGWAGPVIGLGVYLMILARVAVMVRSHRQALARESILLAASENLGVAAGSGQVAAALADGAAGLFAGRGAEHAVVVAVDGPDGIRMASAGTVAGVADGGTDAAVGRALDGAAGAPDESGLRIAFAAGPRSGAPPGSSARPGSVAAPNSVTPPGSGSTQNPQGPPVPVLLPEPDRTAWRTTLREVCDAAQSAYSAQPDDEPHHAGAAAGWRRRAHFHPANVMHTADLPPPLNTLLAPEEHTGVVPLGTANGAPDPEGPDRAAGMLIVAAAEEDLAVLGGALEILGRQASAALERIALSQEITRRDSEAYFRALVQNTSDTILIVDTEMRVRYASPSSAELFGDRPLLDRPLTEAVGKVYAAEVAVRTFDPAPQPPVCRDWEISAGGGEPHEVEVTIADLRAEPTVGGFVLSLHDVTTARRLERTLQRHAYLDPLTDLPNRLAFLRGLEDAVELSSPAVSVTVMLLDLDRFREINDFHGRDLGDRVLREVAERIRSRLRPGDVLARTGGDEFAVLAVRRAEETPALPVGMPGEDKPFYVGPVAVTTSGAVATCSAGASGASLLADAEMTLHAAKGAGPNSWRSYDPRLRTEVARTATRRSGLDRALAEGSFELYYQPIVWLDDGDIGGFEALIRWPQPDGTVIAPDEFIPLAEATGQILPMGRWILRTATRQAARWNAIRLAQGVAPVKMSVNVSAHQLRDPGFPDEVGKALREAGLDPAFLMVEATESALIDRVGTALANLKTLARHGVGVSLDDFGTGYSSLSYLRDLPVNALKIDKAFVDGVPAEPRQTALVRGIIGIAKSLSLMVVAEGVETSQQRRALARMGADLGQGYLYARPMREPEATALMRAGRVRLPRTLREIQKRAAETEGDAAAGEGTVPGTDAGAEQPPGSPPEDDS